MSHVQSQSHTGDSFGFSPANQRETNAPPNPESADFGAFPAKQVEQPAAQPVDPQEVTETAEPKELPQMHHRVREPGATEEAAGTASADSSAGIQFEEGDSLEAQHRDEQADADLNFMGFPVEPDEPRVVTPRHQELPEPPPNKNRKPLTQDEKDRVVVMVSYGHSLRQAAAQIGRTHSTLSRNLKKDKAFAEKVERYRRYAESDAMREVVAASRKSWRAAAWLLEYLARRERAHVDSEEKKPKESAVRA